jgi:hypothetical protein
VTTTEIAAGDDASAGEGGPVAPDGRAGRLARARRLVATGWRALRARTGLDGWGPVLELAALTAFVVARPIFGSFGRSPETLIARGADWTDVILFGLVITLGPLAVAVAIEVAVGLLAGPKVRRGTHVVLMAGLLTLAVWEIARPRLDLTQTQLLVASLAVAAALTVAWVRLPPVSTFLRYASVGLVVFLVQFLVLSSTGAIVLGGRHVPTAAAAVPDGAPPVVVIVLDGLPTGLLLDGEGAIDAELYPNLAELAGDGTWYRNNTTVAQVTLEAVPAILSGTVPSADHAPPVASRYPRNLFTMLGGSHEVHGGEAITGLCPVRLCPEPAGSPVDGLMRDAGRIFELQLTGGSFDPELVPYVFEGRLPRAAEWVAGQDFHQGDRPSLHMFHLLLPHPGWEYLPDGSPYRGAGDNSPGLWMDTWSGWGQDVARQRHVLQTQAADRLVGDLLDRVRDAGAYDDAVVVLTADHGYAFTDDSPMRGIDEDNLDEILWTPLIVKAPGQRAGAVDDSNVNTTDILPTIAAELGIDLPWEVDGEPFGTAERDPDDKWVVDWEVGRLRPEGDSELVHVDGREGFADVLATDPVAGSGPLAVWQRTEYGHLVGEPVPEAPPLGAGREGPDGAVTLGDPLVDVVASVDGLATWDAVDTAFPPLELTAQAAVPDGTAVAITANGVVAAVVPTIPTAYGVAIIHGLMWPGALRDGANDIGMYALDGPADAPVLHPLDVVPK